MPIQSACSARGWEAMRVVEGFFEGANPFAGSGQHTGGGQGGGGVGAAGPLLGTGGGAERLGPSLHNGAGRPGVAGAGSLGSSAERRPGSTV